MAASATVSQFPPSCNSLIPKRRVITLFGYGIVVTVDRGHLILKCGIGRERYEGRLARIGHGLRRLVIIGSDGFVSLAALRWLSDQDASFVMLERDGSVLAVTGPVRPSDARLRRAQAVASTNGVAFQISKSLIERKLLAQHQVAANKLKDAQTTRLIAANHSLIDGAPTIKALRLLESRAAHAYWSAWRNVPITFPKKDFSRTPEHWRRFGTRISPLTGSPRLSVNPPNAMLNYLYALLESEARLAAAALGLDPGVGLMHADTDARDSLACDLMEPVRPLIDAYVVDWITREPLRREWFVELGDGNCRLTAAFAVRLAETAPTWGRAVAPIVESVARDLWSTVRKPARLQVLATRLTQSNKREAKGVSSDALERNAPPKPPRICRGCGASVNRASNYCAACSLVISSAKMREVNAAGRIAAQSAGAQASRAETLRRNASAQREWKDKGESVNEQAYERDILPRLPKLSISSIATALCVSLSYAADIRKGRRQPHPRHWETLAQMLEDTGHAPSV
jgi:CRISPR-associated endonuclease Cas1